MNKKMLIQIGKELGSRTMDYIKVELLDKLKEACIKAFNAFKETLWENIKDEVYKCIEDIINEAKGFFKTDEWKQQEEFILDTIMDKLSLPFVLKPFKSLIRKIIKNKMEDLIKKVIS